MTTDTHLNRSAIVADNIRAEMARRNRPQRLLAEHLGMSQAAFSARMQGRTPIDINELFAIADLLDLPAAQLLDGAA